MDKINCKSEIQENLITINYFYCAILHSEIPLNETEYWKKYAKGLKTFKIHWYKGLNEMFSPFTMHKFNISRFPAKQVINVKYRIFVNFYYAKEKQIEKYRLCDVPKWEVTSGKKKNECRNSILMIIIRRLYLWTRKKWFITTTLNRSRKAKKMDDYLYRIVSASNLMEVHLLGEQMIYVMDNQNFQNGRKKMILEENVKHGKESNYNFYS